MKVSLVMSRVVRQDGGTREDRLLADSLERAGNNVEMLDWDGEHDWARYDVLVLRSCWDYHLRVREFREWLDLLERLGVQVWNPVSLVRWNIDKRYLRELDERGIPTVPTFYFEPGDDRALALWLDQLGAEELVVKATVGATAHECHRIDPDGLASLTESTSSDQAWLVQPFLPEIVHEGEWSLLWLDGQFSHAVIKRPKAGDFRVQGHWGGTAERRVPDAALLRVARRVLGTLELKPLYARVDLVEYEGTPALMEVELIEPQLFLEEGDWGLDLLVDGLMRRRAAPECSARGTS